MNIPRPTARPTILAALATAIFVCLFVGIVPATRSARKSISSRADAASASTSAAAASYASALVEDEPYVRLFQLSAKDLAVDPVTQTIYASVPSTAGASGNSIVAVNPSTGALAPPVFVGSEPNQLAVTDDGRYVYVALDGAGAVRRFDTQTQTAGPQYTLGNDSFDGPLFSLSLSLAPGSADTFAVFRLAKAGGFSGNVAVFDGGVRREKTFALAENSAWVAFGATASRLYSFAPLPRRFTKLNAAPDGLTSAGGFTIDSAVSVDSMKFDSGLLYSASGRVIDPEAGTLVGSFDGGALRGDYAIDSKAGRAYYVKPNLNPSTLTIQAYDLKTFLPVGSIDIRGVSGGSTALVRWGANGLALATDGGQLFLIQTSLVSSAEPVPTATPTPSPTPPVVTPTPQSYVRQLSLQTKDIAYSNASQLLYASVPSTAGASGNSITSIDPSAGMLLQSTFVGSEPGQMEPTADGQYIYVALTGASGIRRFDVATHTAGPQLTLINNLSGGADSAADFAPLPGNNGSIAVSATGLAIYDGDVRRAKMGPGAFDSTIEFSASPTRLYGARPSAGGFDLRRISIDASGVASTETVPNVLGSAALKFDRGRLYTFTRVFDPEAAALLGTFRLIEPGDLISPRCESGSYLPDPTTDRVFFLCSGTGSGGPFTSGAPLTTWIAAFDAKTFVPLGKIIIDGAFGRMGRLVRWGSNGLAFRTEVGQLFIVQSTLVSGAQPTPTPTPTPSPTPPATPSPTPTPAPGELREIQLVTKDLVVDPSTQTIYASVPSSDSAHANSITPIDPFAGSVGTSVSIGSEPGRMAISDDGKVIYVALDGANAVRRFDVQTRTAGLQFGLGNDPNFGWAYSASDLSVMPGHPETVAVSRSRPASPSHGGVAIYDNGVQRLVTTPDRVGSNFIKFSASPAVLYGQNSGDDYAFRTMVVAQCGVSTAKVTPGIGFYDFTIDNGVGYGIGRAFDPSNGVYLGTFNGASATFAVESKAGRIYHMVGSVLRVYDLNSYLLLGELRIPGINPAFDTISRVVRWGDHGLAFNTGTKVYLLQNALIGGVAVPAPSPAPTPPTPSFTVTGTVFASPNASGVQIDATGSINSSSTLTSESNTFSFGGIPACGSVKLTPHKENYSFTPASVTFNNPSEIQPINFFATQDRVHFAKDSITVPEGDNHVTISITRVGDATGPASVDYETVAGTASDRSDYTAVSGTLFFAANETTKTVDILLNDDAIVEGSESFTLRLKSPTGAVLNAPSIMTVSIADNDSAEPTANPLQDATYFVRQHYHDFLNREPDAAGLAFWVSQLNACNTLQNPQARGTCLEDRRVNVSAAFFLSIEFQQTGYLVHRFYTASFPASAARPAGLPRLTEFLRDTQEIGRGVVVGAQGWEQQLETNKRAFALAWVQRPEFLAEFPESMGAEAYINKLFSNAGVTPTPTEFNIAFDAYNNGGVEGRANVLRSVADSGSVYNRQYNSAVVMMQYIGYLRRNPNDAPDSDLAGYNFWLTKLNEFSLPGEDVRDGQAAARRVRRAEMVRAFLVSLEYEQRFGPTNFDIRK